MLKVGEGVKKNTHKKLDGHNQQTITDIWNNFLVNILLFGAFTEIFGKSEFQP